MDLKTLIPIILVAILTVLGNILFFRYQFKKDIKRKVLDQQLTDLLLPLYYVLKEHQLSSSEWAISDSYDYVEDIIGEPKILMKKIIPIIKNKLYLADDELHLNCINFLEWVSTIDEHEQYQKAMQEGLPNNEPLNDFRKLVYEKYNQARDKYLKLK